MGRQGAAPVNVAVQHLPVAANAGAGRSGGAIAANAGAGTCVFVGAASAANGGVANVGGTGAGWWRCGQRLDTGGGGAEVVRD